MAESGSGFSRLGRSNKNHVPRIRRRYAYETKDLPFPQAPGIWAARLRARAAGDEQLATRLTALLEDIYAEFGLRARVGVPLAGRLVQLPLWLEERRLAAGWTYEPPTFCERNAAALEAHGVASGPGVGPVRSVACRPRPVSQPALMA